MKYRGIFFFAVVFVAMVVFLTPTARDKSATMGGGTNIGQMAGQASGEYSQPKPYTKDFFGPWNAQVAQTHVPQVNYYMTDTGLKVTIKIDNHPMDPKKPHWIMWIRLEDGMGNKLGEKTFKATDPAPVATFELKSMPDVLKATERCNIHGIWLNEVKVEMK